MEIRYLAKRWIYNELADIPEEFIEVEMTDLRELDQAIEKELENNKDILEHQKEGI